MHGYFARLAQRSDIAPAAMAPRAPARSTHTDDSALEQHTEVIVAPSTGNAVTASRSMSIASPPGGANTVAPSSSAPPDLRPGMRTGMTLSPGVPVQEEFAHREPLAVATPAVHAAAGEAHPSASTTDDNESALPQRRDGNQAQRAPSVLSAPSSQTGISTARHATAASSSPALAESGRTMPTASPGTEPERVALRTSRAESTPHADTQSPQPAAASVRAPLQVHIGRIELEVHQPSPAVVPPPAAPPEASPRRSPSFNPRRHYLRDF